MVLEAQASQPDAALKSAYDQILWLADAYYELTFSLDTDLSDWVLFPVSDFERKGMEDAWFVRFVEDDGGIVYYATYTACDGYVIAPKLLMTRDFYCFRGMPLHGAGARNKNLALFPRKINGRYAMLSRIDGWRNYLMFSNNLNLWEFAVQLQEPQSPWEFIQIGNCGPPIETEHGWLVVTHGVGPMRRYCLGVSLLRAACRTVAPRPRSAQTAPRTGWGAAGPPRGSAAGCGALAPRAPETRWCDLDKTARIY